MARSNKPLLWLPFAMGGTIAALLLPALVLVTLLPGLGLAPHNVLAASRFRPFAEHLLGALAIMVVLTSLLWHAAHRLRMTMQDLGARGAVARKLVIWLCYGTASVGTLLLAGALLSLLSGS